MTTPTKHTPRVSVAMLRDCINDTNCDILIDDQPESSRKILALDLRDARALNAELVAALRYYANGEPCCKGNDGAAVSEGCGHPTCEFPQCAEVQFPIWDAGVVARAALAKAEGRS